MTERSIVVLPIGSIEHHGPHLPLITDALIAEAVTSEAVAQSAGRIDVWQLPTLSYSKSDEHSWAPGTVWLDARTLFETVVDIGRSVAATPARRLAFVNGHGGNVALLQMANRELRRRFGLQTFLLPAGVSPAGNGTGGAPDERGLGIHAGYAETSLVMHLRPDLVDDTLFERNVPEFIAEFRYLGFHSKAATFGWLSDDFGPSGVIGDPTGASPDVGAELFAGSVRFVLDVLDEVDRFPLLP